MSKRPVYRLEIKAEPGVDAIAGLRALLKRMLRSCGYRCIKITPVLTETEATPATVRANQEAMHRAAERQADAAGPSKGG